MAATSLYRDTPLKLPRLRLKAELLQVHIAISMLAFWILGPASSGPLRYCIAFEQWHDI